MTTINVDVEVDLDEFSTDDIIEYLRECGYKVSDKDETPIPIEYKDTFEQIVLVLRQQQCYNLAQQMGDFIREFY